MYRIYTAPLFLQDEGFDLANLTNNQLWSMIRDVSAVVDNLTGQWFNAEYGTWFFNGRGRELINHPHLVPILRVESVEVLADNTNYRNASFPEHTVDYPFNQSAHVGHFSYGGTGALAATEYQIQNRMIERIRNPFPGGVKNVQVVGALGWIEDHRYVATTTTAQLTEASTSITVTDVAGFKYRDVVEVVNGNDIIRFIITEINPATNTLTFTTGLGREMTNVTVDAGAVVRTFGQVPRAIESLTNYLLGEAIAAVRARAAGANIVIDPARIKREETDDYEYELFAPGQAAALVTGSAKYDNILMAFSRPGGVRII